MPNKFTIRQRMLLLFILFFLGTFVGTYVSYSLPQVVAVCIKEGEKQTKSFPYNNDLCLSDNNLLPAIEWQNKSYKLVFNLKNTIGILDILKEKFLLGYLLLLLLLTVGNLYWVLRPLRQLKEDMGGLESTGNRSLDASHYPNDLLPLAQKLNELLYTTRDTEKKVAEAEKEAAEAEKEAAEAEKKADETEKKLSQVIDARMYIAREVRVANSLLKHDIQNVENKIATPFEDLPEELQRFVQGWREIGKKTEEFTQSIYSIIYEDTAIIHKVLDERKKRQLDAAPEIQLDAEGVEDIQDIRVSISPHQLDKIFSELLENAVKYCGPPRKILVCAKKSPGQISVEFHNHISTFPEKEELDRWFEFGTRGQHEGIWGSGFGLYEIKKIAKRARGCVLEVKPSTKLHVGICFSLKVPIYSPGTGLD